MADHRSNSTARGDVYTRVTDGIIAALEQGVRPWHRPWSGARTGRSYRRPLRHNGTPYRGINILLLWGEMLRKGFTAAPWMTYRQAKALGAHIRKGETGSLVVYADRVVRTETTADGDGADREIRFLKGYTVFNVEQIEGLPAPFYAPPDTPPRATVDRIADAFVAATGAVIRHAGNRAYYSPSADVIVLPVAEAFRDAESYTATKLHELTHWTAHASRLDRTLGTRFGDDAYAAEELVAELGAAFLGADLGLAPEPREDHASYISAWLKVLRDDRRAIFTAASHAQRAVDYLHALQPEPKAGAA